MAATDQLTSRLNSPETNPIPSTSSKMIITLANREQRSKEKNPKEKRYKSKPSTDESFDIAEAQKRAPKMILKGNPYLFSSRDTLDFTIGVDVYATYAELAV